jgi:AcrR family transcriptional regulator
MAVTRTPRRAWVDEGLRALAGGGPEAVRIEALARALGVTKGGFYWHFDDRPALLDEMLDTWEEIAVDHAIEHVEAGGGDSRAKLRRLFDLASALGADLLRVELAVRDWARRDAAVGDRLRRVDNRRMVYLRSLFGELGADEDEAEARSVLAFSLFIGSHFMAADHEGRSRGEAVTLATEHLLT